MMQTYKESNQWKKDREIPELSLIYVRSITKPQLSSREQIRSAESESEAPSPAWDSQLQNIFTVKQLKKINIPSQAEISHKRFLKWRGTLLLCI